MAFVPSALLVAWTNHITTDLASAPFLWLPPLVLFLLTFVLVFRDRPLISLRVARALQLGSVPVVLATQYLLPAHFSVWILLMLLGAVSFFSTAIICHRQLYEARPEAGQLTGFYMLMSVGGVLGGLFVSLIAPLVFTSVAEYPILLLLGVAAQREIFNDAMIRAQLRKPIDPYGATATLLKGDRLKGRIGTRIDYSPGPTASHLYAAANATYEFLGGTSIDISGTKFAFNPQRLGGEFAVGGTYNWDKDSYGLFGEATLATSFTGSYEAKATGGLRAKF